MSPLRPLFRSKEYVVLPSTTWWNPDVVLAFEQDGLGLITGQETVDDVLNAMDAA
jgi:raffinose/stachyose/melibiose transport system substrate-binding protein